MAQQQPIKLTQLTSYYKSAIKKAAMPYHDILGRPKEQPQREMFAPPKLPTPEPGSRMGQFDFFFRLGI
jgi:hypothetical protein